MEAVEAAVHPMLERIRSDRWVPDGLAQEHDEIRRLVDLVGEFAVNPEAACRLGRRARGGRCTFGSRTTCSRVTWRRRRAN